jgi:hypothetical protein
MKAEKSKIDFVKELGHITLSKADVFRKKFKEEKGINWLNSQGEPDIEYVDWLEYQLRNRNEYARIQIEKDRERVFESVVREDYFINEHDLEIIYMETPIILD